MPESSHPLHFSIVRIRDANGTIVGAGFLATPKLVCTCAHVVADALKILNETEPSPEQEVYLDFPFLGGVERRAHVAEWVRIEPDNGGGDIAILRLLTDPPAAAQPARMLRMSTLTGKAFATYGFPSNMDVGQYAYGVLRDRLANGYVQVEGSTAQGYRVQRGYSGTPVWDQQGRGVVGMIVAEDRNPDAKVAFLIPNDLILGACPEIKPVTLHQFFAPLTEGLNGLPGSPLGGVEQFLRSYLGTSEILIPFGGRHLQLATLDRWLVTQGQPYALMVEEAGRGKSALLAEWVAAVADEHRADVAFVPISIRFGTSRKSTAFSLLGARLRYLHNVKADLPRDAEGWLAEIEMYLHQDRSAGPPLLIVLDGADEAADWIVGQDLRLPPEPGRGVKVFVSARPLADCDSAGWVRRLEWPGGGIRVELPLLDRSHVAEILQSMGNPLAGLVTQVDVVRELHRLSGGDPLLVRLYVEALRGTGERAAFLTPEDLGHLQPGLQAYFSQWWDDQRRQWGSVDPLRESAVRTMLNIMACALGALSTDDLLALMEPEGFDLWQLEEMLRPLARFVVGNGKEQGYVFSHPRLSQYFYEKLPARERQAWEKRFTSYGRQTLMALSNGKRDPGEVSSYAVRYYGIHLERGDADPAYFNDLICQEWQRAWKAIEGTYDGFLSDLIRAWKRADAFGARSQSMQERSRVISWQCRNALIVASINSLVGNIPSPLLAALVNKGVWTSVQGLASARQIPNEEQRTEALIGLAPYLSAPLLQEAWDVVQAMTSEWRRTEALIGLAPYLSAPLLQEAWDVVQAMTSEWRRTEALIGLAPYLSAPLLQEAWEMAQAMDSEWRRAQALIGLAPYLSAPLQKIALQEALEAAQAIANEWNQAQALTGLVTRLGELGNGKKALEAARTMVDEGMRAQALIGLAPYLSASLLQEAWEAARTMADEESQTQALVGLVPRLGESGNGKKALEAARTMVDEGMRAQALAGLAPYLSASLLQEAWEAVQAMTSKWNQTQALVGLVPRLGELGDGKKALEAARTMADNEMWAQALAGLAPYLSASLLQEAWEAVQAMTDRGMRTDALAELISHLGKLGNGKKALEVARTIIDEGRRVEVLTGLSPYLPAQLQEIALQEALEAAQAIADEESQAKVLVGLVPHLGELGDGKKALEVALTMVDEGMRAQALAGLAPYLSASLLQEAWEAARTMADEWNQAQALVGLVPRLGELGDGKKALEAARTIIEEGKRAQALAGLAPYLSAPLLQEALEAAQAIAIEWNRAQALAGLAPYLPAPLLQEALEAAQAIADEGMRAQALIGLAPYLSAPLLQEALEAALTMVDEGMRAQALAGLAPYLSASLLQEAWEAARTMTSGWNQIQALVGLVPRLGELGNGKKALEVARTMADEEMRAQALIGLAPYLSAPLQKIALQEALEAAKAIAIEWNRAEALADLAPYLPAPLLQEALEVARTIIDEERRAQALTGLASHLSASLQEIALQEALEAAKAIADKWRRARALTRLVPCAKQLPFVKLYSLWSQNLHILAIRTRPDLLSDMQALVPLIEVLGEKEALVATLQSIFEVGKWFP